MAPSAAQAANITPTAPMLPRRHSTSPSSPLPPFPHSPASVSPRHPPTLAYAIAPLFALWARLVALRLANALLQAPLPPPSPCQHLHSAFPRRLKRSTSPLPRNLGPPFAEATYLRPPSKGKRPLLAFFSTLLTRFSGPPRTERVPPSPLVPPRYTASPPTPLGVEATYRRPPSEGQGLLFDFQSPF